MLTHYFAALTERMDVIQAKMPHLNEEEKQVYYQQVLDLRALSDSFVEDWLTFEEKLVSLQRLFEQPLETFSGLSTGAPASPFPSVSSEPVASHATASTESEAYLSLPVAMQFRKGQGYFALSMYEEAVHSFRKVVEQEPDFQLARLYLAFGFLMSNHFEVAYRQFHLLANTSDHPLIKATAYNALGCIAVIEKKADHGVGWFDRALHAAPAIQDAAFNKALTLYHAGKYAECVHVIQQMNKAETDIEIQLLLFSALLKSGCTDEAAESLKHAQQMASQEGATSRDLRTIAHGFEQLRLFADAEACYRLLLPAMRKEAWVWHGLGWSLWQQNKSMEAVSYLQRALTLAPKHDEYACSYAWMMLGLGESEKAWRIFHTIEQRENGSHEAALAVAGMIEILLQVNSTDQHVHGKIERLTLKLLEDTRPHTQALGHYQAGKLYLLTGDRTRALQHFSQSEALIQERAVYAGLLHYLDGNEWQAYDKWKMAPIL